ncbi:MAG: radical SAM family heme chaperone HemW [Bacillota bacterium]|jgi:oxygen-independent coproporphyrinogen-3 oxidase|nr:radical SAM family heme chaperone HemW [Bacillota bacterium]NLL60909.1 radical SAM family heme chaperone HemW [Tissierellia bacterium]
MKKLGIYIHVPFCIKKCGYCDFYSVKWDEESENSYIRSAIDEIKGYRELEDYIVDTIFIGGGTPSVIMPQNIEKLIAAVKDTFTVAQNAEISMEANPNSLSQNLKIYKETGINRLSIGIQSLKDDILKRIGRIHNFSEALQAIDLAQKQGFDNINADVMFNIPGQTLEDITDTIYQLISKDIRHISFYSLKLEEGTQMYSLEKNKVITMPVEDLEREMYYAGRTIMEEHGLMQYEISNFAVKGYECRHNLKYWNQEEYIGIGPSAHSFMGNTRYSNPSNLKEYTLSSGKEGFKRNIQEVMDEDELMFEYIMLRLRLTEGLKFAEFKNKFNRDFEETYKAQIEKLLKDNLIYLDDEGIRLTHRGMDISNYVFASFM